MGKWEKKEDMTLEEAKALRASKHKVSAPVLTEQQKKEQFRLFWAQNRTKYGSDKSLEEILWIHLTAAKLNDPSKFEEGMQHFGLKKVK